MKQFILLALSMFIYINVTIAQCTPPASINDCFNAPVLCFGIDGYCGTLSDEDMGRIFPGCPTSILNNTDIVSFIAESEFLEILITPSSCTVGANQGVGLQAGLYGDCDGQTIIAVDCGSSQEAPISLTGILVPGQLYFLFIDGFGGSICNYEINVLEGSTMAPDLSGLTPVINAPPYVENNETYTFSIDPIGGAPYVTWHVTGGEVISVNGNEASVLVTDDSNFEICANAGSECSISQTTCETVGSNPYFEIIEESICVGACFEFNATLFCEEGTFEIEVENGNGSDLYLIIITEVQTIETFVEAHVCFGECYEFNSSTLCESGVYTASLVSSTGCDSIVTLALTVLESNEPTVAAENTGDLDCVNLTTTLSAYSSVDGSSFLWSGPGINAANQNLQSFEVEVGGLYTVFVTTSSGCTNFASTEVFGEPESPEITITGNDPFNCNNDENTIIVSAAISGLDYEWIGPGGFSETGPEITVTELGDYILIFTTPSGCTDAIVVTVAENNEPLFVDPGPNRHIQCEFILTLDAPGAEGTNVVYEWTTLLGNIIFGENTLNPVVNKAGVYTLTATDLSNGCTGSADMIVYADMAIINEDYWSITCDEPTVQIDASESYSGLDAEIIWTTSNGNIVSGENTLTPIVDAGGIYQLVISRPGCLSFATTTVLDGTVAPIVDILPSAPVIACGTPVVLASYTNTNTPEYTWTLDGEIISTDPLYITSVPGEYNLEIENVSTGCSGFDTFVLVEVQDPESVAINGDLTLDCTLNGVGHLSAVITGDEPLYNSIWSALNGGEIISGNIGTEITIFGSGTYCIEVENPLNGCVLFECIDVIEVSSIELNPEVTDASCPSSFDGSIFLDVTGGTTPYSYIWSTGELDVNPLTDLGPGEYSVTVADIDGCLSFQTFNIEVSGLEDVTADAGEDQSLNCVNNTLVLDGGASVFPPGTTFQWIASNGGTIAAGGNTLFPAVVSAGTYTLIIFSPEGCTDSDEVVVTEYEANAGPAQILDCNNTSIQLQAVDNQAGSSYEWTTNDGNIVDGGNTLNPTVDQAGTYTFVVTDANGCSYTDETTVDTDFDIPDASVANTEVFLENCDEPVWVQGQSTTPGVTYSWSGPSGTSSEANFSVELEGTYSLTVSGTNGCTNTATVQVIDQTAPPILTANPQTQYLNCFNGIPLLLDVSIETFTNDIEVTWFTQNGNIVEMIGNSVSVDQAGTYQLTVIDNGNNCIESITVFVEEREGLIEVETTIASCGIPDATASINTTYIHDPEFLWSTGATSANVQGLGPDIYTVTITSPQSACDEVRTVEIVQDPSCFVIISGYIYDDQNLTCTENGINVSPKEGVVVTITPEDLETTTDVEGYYEFLVPPGDYTVEPQLISPFIVECPSGSIDVSVPAGTSGSEGNNFFVKALSGFDLFVTAGSGPANAGNNQFYQANYCNNGFTSIFGTVEFVHDPLLEFDPVAAGASSYDPDTYTAVWEYEDLSFFECTFLSFQVFVPEDIPDGTEISSTITILPTQGDIQPANNSTSWTRIVNNSTNTSMISQEEEVLDVGSTINNLDNAVITAIRQYPNPFSEQTTIEFVLQTEEEIKLQIFDITGRLVYTYTGFEKGFNKLQITETEIPVRGVLFYKIIGETMIKSGKMIKK